MDGDPQYGSGGDWLTPTVALTRFIPPAPAATGGEAVGTRPSRFGFLIGNIGLLLAPEALSEVIEETVIHPIPNTPPWFSGMINLRGNLVPVFDLKTLFGFPDKLGDTRRLLVVDKGDKAVAIRIDGLPRALAPDRCARQLPPLPPVLTKHVRKAYILEREIWLEFDFEAFFTMVGKQLAA